MKTHKTSLNYCFLALKGICGFSPKADIDATGCGYWGVMQN